MSRATLSLALALLVCACATGPPLSPLARVTADPAGSLQADLVTVRLAALEGAERAVIEGGSGGSLVVRCELGSLVASDGRRGRRLECEPARPGGTLRVAGRSYPGRLCVEALSSGGLRVTNEVALEKYVQGVVAGELVLWSAHEEEIAAQATAARTYAVWRLASRARSGREPWLWDDTRDQVYLGHFPAATSTGEVARRLRTGTQASSGLVLLRAGELESARFHASCGGWTGAAAEVFPGESAESYGAARCTPCEELARREDPRLASAASATGEQRVAWSHTVDAPTLSRTTRELGLGERVTALGPAEVDAHGRWLSVTLAGERGERRLNMNELRRRLGPTELRSGRILSTWPAAGAPITSGMYFAGVGYGHGAGLCQTGCHEYAARGWSAERILLHYYPGARIVPLEQAR